MPYLLFLKKQQNLKFSSAANYRWLFMGKRTSCVLPSNWRGQMFDCKSTHFNDRLCNICFSITLLTIENVVFGVQKTISIYKPVQTPSLPVTQCDAIAKNSLYIQWQPLTKTLNHNRLQGIFSPSLGAEFWPHNQWKIATFSPQYHVWFSKLRKVTKQKKIFFFFFFFFFLLF